jgi:hypothetical protein
VGDVTLRAILAEDILEVRRKKIDKLYLKVRWLKGQTDECRILLQRANTAK